MLPSEIVNLSTQLEAQAKPHETQCKAREFYEALHTGLNPTLWCQTDRFSL